MHIMKLMSFHGNMLKNVKQYKHCQLKKQNIDTVPIIKPNHALARNFHFLYHPYNFFTTHPNEIPPRDSNENNLSYLLLCVCLEPPTRL